MDITLLTCNYNTPTETFNMLKSLRHTTNTMPEILVINTSSSDESEKLFSEFNIPFKNLFNGTHGEGVNCAFEQIHTKYVLLVDTDIIFLKDFYPVFEYFKNHEFTLMGKVVGDCGGKSLYPRVEPWFCLMDLQKLKSCNIKFFDPVRSKKIDKYSRIYDIGSSMFEDVLNNGLLIGDVDLNEKYFRHYGGMSWRVQKYNPSDVDTDIDFGGTHPHKSIYDSGILVKQKYDIETEYLKKLSNNIQ